MYIHGCIVFLSCVFSVFEVTFDDAGDFDINLHAVADEHLDHTVLVLVVLSCQTIDVDHCRLGLF